VNSVYRFFKLKTNKKPEDLTTKDVCLIPRDAGKFGGVEGIWTPVQSNCTWRSTCLECRLYKSKPPQHSKVRQWPVRLGSCATLGRRLAHIAC